MLRATTTTTTTTTTSVSAIVAPAPRSLLALALALALAVMLADRAVEVRGARITATVVVAAQERRHLMEGKAYSPVSRFEAREHEFMFSHI